VPEKKEKVKENRIDLARKAQEGIKEPKSHKIGKSRISQYR